MALHLYATSLRTIQFLFYAKLPLNLAKIGWVLRTLLQVPKDWFVDALLYLAYRGRLLTFLEQSKKQLTRKINVSQSS
jgi:hypothetical protein